MLSTPVFQTLLFCTNSGSDAVCSAQCGRGGGTVPQWRGGAVVRLFRPGTATVVVRYGCTAVQCSVTVMQYGAAGGAAAAAVVRPWCSTDVQQQWAALRLCSAGRHSGARLGSLVWDVLYFLTPVRPTLGGTLPASPGGRVGAPGVSGVTWYFVTVSRRCSRHSCATALQFGSTAVLRYTASRLCGVWGGTVVRP